MAEITPCAELLPDTPLPDGAPPTPELGNKEQLEVYGAGDERAVVITQETEDDMVIRHHWSSSQDASLARQLLAALRSRHGPAGKKLVLRLSGTQTALFDAVGNTPGGQIMAKSVDGSVVLSPDVAYRAMAPAEAEEFVEQCRRDFPFHMRENRPGLTLERAEEMTTKAFTMAAPQGVQSPGHSYLVVETAAGGEAAAHLWIYLNEETKESFCYYLRVLPECRRKGYGVKTLAAWEHFAFSQGARSLRLNVFRTNTAARALYQRGGFQTTEGSLVIGD